MKKYLLKLLLFFVPIVLFILLLETFGHLFVKKISHNKIDAKNQLLIPKVDSNSIVILGDSRLEWGLKTQEIMNKGGNVINLAMPGSNGHDIIEYLIAERIYPKLILIGFSPNYGRYINHGILTQKISKTNLFLTSSKYWVKQNSYTYDIETIKLYLEKKEPYLIQHQYDELGNVTVIENGHFYKRLDHQLKMYRFWDRTFSKIDFDKYLVQTKKIKTKLVEKTHFWGIYMPVSDTIHAFEKDHYNLNEIKHYFDDFIDLSQFNTSNDSTFFYDGSHLKTEIAIQISQDISKRVSLLK